MRLRLAGLVGITTFAAIEPAALATTDGPANYDARSVAMGGTGVSFVHNGAAVYHNPAALEGMRDLAVTAVVSPFGPQLTTPVAGPDTEVESTRTFFPLFFLGGGYRVAKPLVVGAGVYAAGGLGAKYENLDALGGADLELGVAVIDIALPAVSFAITDRLSIGGAWRTTFMTETVDQPGPMGMGTIRTSLSGWSFLGAQLGLFYKPIDPLRLGLSYRTKVTADLDGETTAPSPMGEVSLDTTSEFSTPHKFTLGASYDVNEKLLLALDAKYILYADSNKELSTTTTIPMVGEQTQTIPFDWKNVFGVAVGAEYHMVSSVPLRLGYNLSTSATPEETAGIFVTPPGLVHGFHAGAGLDLKNWAFDIGGAYAIVGSDVDDSTQGFAGHYAMNVMILSLGATYRM